MTVTTTTNRVNEQGNGVKTAFDFTFKVFAATDLQVFKVVRATGVATLQTITTDYTVSLTDGGDSGGTVTYVTAPLSTEDSLIIRTLTIDQQFDIPVASNLPEEQLENAYDKAIMILQQLDEELDRSLLLPVSSTITDLTIPNPVANNLLGWNSGATNLENKVITDASTTVISAFIATLLDDSDAAEARTTLGAEQIITNLTAITSLENADQVVVADNSDSDTSRKITWQNVLTAIVTHLQANVLANTTLPGVIEIATKAEQESGTGDRASVTSRQQHHRSAVKASVNFNGTGTIAMRSNYNVSSITDNNTGDYTINFDVDFATANYEFALGVGESATIANADVWISQGESAPAAGSFRVVCHDSGVGARDMLFVSAIFTGLQA